MAKSFQGNFTQQEPISEEAIEQAVAVMRSGRIHRYNVVAGEVDETAQLELEFAAYTGAKYCLAVASGGYAMQTAMRAAGVKAGDAVLTNAFTLSPVPGSIAAVGAKPVLVETTDQLILDLGDLETKAKQSKAKFLLLSHMRGHMVDMDALMALAGACDFQVIEDCAHTMGASWRGTPSGRHGLAGCYSTQTYKHINSGEGGFLTSDDPEFMARAIILSGSYMLYGRHLAGPPAETFTNIRLETPNCSGRMDNLRAAILRPQLKQLDANRERWNARYRAVEAAIKNIAGLSVPRRANEETYVGSSIQFLANGLSENGIMAFIALCKSRGVELKWFGAKDPVAYTSKHDSWRYVEPQSLLQTEQILSKLCDMRLPLTFSVADCALIGEIIAECFSETRQTNAQGKTILTDSSAMSAA